MGHFPTSIAGALIKTLLGVPRLLGGPVRTLTEFASNAVGETQTVGRTKLTGARVFVGITEGVADSVGVRVCVGVGVGVSVLVLVGEGMFV